MSCVIVVAPVVITAWPILAAAVASACAAAGFRTVGSKKKAAVAAPTSVELSLENAEVVEESMRADDEIVVEKDGVRVRFTRDARGQFKTCVEGHGRSKDELRAIGEDLSGRVVQQYVHARLTDELAKSGFATVTEERGPDDSIKLHVRRFEA